MRMTASYWESSVNYKYVYSSYRDRSACDRDSSVGNTTAVPSSKIPLPANGVSMALFG